MIDKDFFSKLYWWFYADQNGGDNIIAHEREWSTYLAGMI